MIKLRLAARMSTFGESQHQQCIESSHFWGCHCDDWHEDWRDNWHDHNLTADERKGPVEKPGKWVLPNFRYEVLTS
jgi:hypothetical protein